MKKTSRRGVATAWIPVLILALGVGAAIWGVERKWRAQTERRQEEIASLRKETARLAALRDDLQRLLGVAPCAIPDEVDGLPLSSALPAPHAAQAETHGGSQADEDMSAAPHAAPPATRI